MLHCPTFYVCKGWVTGTGHCRIRSYKGAEMVNVYWLRGKIGDAVWLWMALNGGLQKPPNIEDEWFPVFEGKPIGDSQIGQALFADGETVIAWRSRLESLGLIRT